MTAAHSAVTSIALRLAEVYGSLLGGRHVALDVSLLDQGADSLLLMSLLAEIEAEYDVFVDAEDLLDHPSLRELAGVVAEKRSGDG